MTMHSIRFQLTAWYASLVTAVFVLLGILMFAGLSHYLEKNLAENQLRRASQIGDTLLVNVKRTGDFYVISEIKALYAPENNDRFIRITRQDGTVLYRSDSPRDQSFQAADIAPLTLSKEKEAAIKQKLPGDRTLLIGALNFQTPDGSRFLVEVGAPTTAIESMLARLRFQLLVGLPLIVALAVSGGYLLIRRALAPVDQIAKKAEQITQHNLSERLPVTRTADELERLSISLNRMIARLEDAFLNSKRFVADASHELRTPLTVMRGELESLAQDQQLAPQLRESVGSVLEEVERLAKIVEGLLAISRLDAGEAQTEWVRFDLAELATTTADQMSLLAADKRVSVTCTAASCVFVQGDRARLKQVIVNLLDNAIKYTPERGSVNVSVTARNGRAVLEVTDTGPGIPAEALPHVFDRFYRVDQVRSRDLGGSGLGLSIVKSICTAHGAEVRAYSTPGKGSRFEVELRALPTPTNNHKQLAAYEH
jgi:heavy metal sensor kinase